MRTQFASRPLGHSLLDGPAGRGQSSPTGGRQSLEVKAQIDPAPPRRHFIAPPSNAARQQSEMRRTRLEALGITCEPGPGGKMAWRLDRAIPQLQTSLPPRFLRANPLTSVRERAGSSTAGSAAYPEPSCRLPRASDA